MSEGIQSKDVLNYFLYLKRLIAVLFLQNITFKPKPKIYSYFVKSQFVVCVSIGSQKNGP